MCGLVGVIGDINKDDKDVLQTLLHLDILRGPHSTGVAVVDKNKDVKLVKRVGAPSNLFDAKQYEKAIQPFNLRVLMGHNRFATKGAINQVNAHPFEIGDVVGAHNGTLTSTYTLDDANDFDVDSEAIIHTMNNKDVAETLPLIRGAYALTIYDKRTDTFYMARNDQRTLFYTWSDDKRKVYYASESWMLTVALNRSNIKYGDIYMLPVGQLYQFKLDKDDKKPIALAIRKFTPYEAPPIVNGYFNGNTNNNKNAVVPINSGTKRDSRFQVGKVVEFEVEEIGAVQNMMRSLTCRTLIGNEIIRISLGVSDPMLNTMTESLNTFTAVINSWVSYGDISYMRVDEKSIREVHLRLDEPEEATELTDWKGNKIKDKQWKHFTRHGCANCQTHVTKEEAHTLTWISRECFICPDCVDLDIVQAYKRH